MLSRLIAFWFAATATWWGNRRYAFACVKSTEKMNQWLRHMLSAHVSGAINLAGFYYLSSQVTLPIAFVAGVILGLGANYLFANKFVFVQRQT